MNGKFQQVVVSPEIAISSSFQKGVTSKEGFSSRLRALCIDEAHCMTLWGGTFRPDYGNLGILRGRFPKNVPIVVASATLPEHILDDIRRKLRLSQTVKMVSVSNARPIIALSVRAMQHSDESKADLRFLIPKDASKPEDIPVTRHIEGNVQVIPDNHHSLGACNSVHFLKTLCPELLELSCSLRIRKGETGVVENIEK